MEKPTIEEVLELVSFRRDEDGKLYVRNVYGNLSNVHGNVYGDVDGNVGGSVLGSVYGNVRYVRGKILNK